MKKHHLALHAMLMLASIGAPTAVRAAPPGATTAPAGREADPLRCWSRTSAAAVHVGEHFTYVLTCAVLEAPTLKVFVDESKLDPNAAQFPPFDVVSGSHAADVREGDYRFFQYAYQLRVIDDSLFGKTATIPAVSLSYRLDTGTDRGASNEGMEQAYVAPAQPIRIMALVGDEPSDIRDADATTFEQVAGRALHAGGLVTAGGMLFGLSALFAVAAAVRAATLTRAVSGTGERPPHARTVVRAVRRELVAIRRERDDAGWTPALADRVVAALRIAGRFLLDQPVTYRPVDAHTPVAPGALAFDASLGRPLLVWGTITAESVSEAVPHAAPQRRHHMERLEVQLQTLAQSRYGRDEQLSPETFDAALDLGDDLSAALGREHGWIAQGVASVRRLVSRRRA